MREIYNIPCVIDPRQSCPTDCRLASITRNVLLDRIGLGLDTGLETHELRKALETMRQKQVRKLMKERIDQIKKFGLGPQICTNYRQGKIKI